MQKTNIITIKDLDKELKFKITLFGALEGLDFFDKATNILANKNSLSIKPFLNDLLPLAFLMDEKGINEIQKMDLKSIGVLVENPLTILELAIEIFKFQEVFTKGSSLFRPLIEIVKQLYSTLISK